jgi:acetyltransferase-like isoleucine patch superfamily enzyme
VPAFSIAAGAPARVLRSIAYPEPAPRAAGEG